MQRLFFDVVLGIGIGLNVGLYLTNGEVEAQRELKDRWRNLAVRTITTNYQLYQSLQQCQPEGTKL